MNSGACFIPGPEIFLQGNLKNGWKLPAGSKLRDIYFPVIYGGHRMGQCIFYGQKKPWMKDYMKIFFLKRSKAMP